MRYFVAGLAVVWSLLTLTTLRKARNFRFRRLPWGLGRDFTITSGSRMPIFRIALFHLRRSTSEGKVGLRLFRRPSIRQGAYTTLYTTSLSLTFLKHSFQLTLSAYSGATRSLVRRARLSRDGLKRLLGQYAPEALAMIPAPDSPDGSLELVYPIRKWFLCFSCGRTVGLNHECPTTKS